MKYERFIGIFVYFCPLEWQAWWWRSFLSAVMVKFHYVAKRISCKLSYAAYHALKLCFFGTEYRVDGVVRLQIYPLLSFSTETKKRENIKKRKCKIKLYSDSSDYYPQQLGKNVVFFSMAHLTKIHLQRIWVVHLCKR